MTETLHPRPQMRRRDWTDLCGAWEFAHDDADEGLAAGWARGDRALPRQIMVPFPPESDRSGIGDKGFHPVVWYRRSFAAPDRRGRPAAAALRRRRLCRPSLGQRRACRRACGRAGFLHRRHQPRAPARGAAGGGRPCRGSAGRRDPAARQAGLAARAARYLVPSHHRHLAAGLAGAGPGCLYRRPQHRSRSASLRLPGDGGAGAACAGGNRRRAPVPRRRDAGARFCGSRRRRRPAVPARPGAGERAGAAGPLLDAGKPDAARSLDHRERCRWPGDRRGGELRRPEVLRREGEPVPAERPALLPALGARAGLLAGVAPCRAGRGCAAAGGGADQGAGVQRRAHSPEGRGSALSLLVRPARPRGLGRDGQCLCLLAAGGRAADPRVAGGGAPRPQPPFDRRPGCRSTRAGASPTRRCAPSSGR